MKNLENISRSCHCQACCGHEEVVDTIILKTLKKIPQFTGQNSGSQPGCSCKKGYYLLVLGMPPIVTIPLPLYLKSQLGMPQIIFIIKQL